MKDGNVLYFAYGSNINKTQMEERCPGSKLVGNGAISGYRLLFRGPYGSAVATVEPFESGTVPVRIWELTPNDVELLDRHEGYPYKYRREEVVAKMRNKTVDGVMYIMNNTGRPLNRPSDEYYGKILDGYREAGFSRAELQYASEYSQEMEETEVI
ncbi:MAG: gamma-glutamylcyclotransferase [Clostridiales bacterium]|jgi:gamma-glutamylcyclotransferase (GGCT)/AIG2-like uncharacterized protein YtfP|nr:gamma-glutamylcyclotransferase [Clostridiales bacterium]MDR2749107.1 gamma-glutamylcyclotransferase [Clostridiales bacterium]